MTCRNQSAKHYRHRASPDCNTVASFDSSSSESRNGGLNRYYRQAWQNLHESTSIGPKSSNHSPLRRKETMDEPYRKEGTERTRDTSEMVVSDGARGGAEKKRHHHHHHHHKEWNRPPKRYWQSCMVITVQFEDWLFVSRYLFIVLYVDGPDFCYFLSVTFGGVKLYIRISTLEAIICTFFLY